MCYTKWARKIHGIFFGKIVDDGKISDGHISVKDYFTCEKIWDKFEMKNKGDYHDHYLKKDVFLSVDVFESLLLRA